MQEKKKRTLLASRKEVSKKKTAYILAFSPDSINKNYGFKKTPTYSLLAFFWSL